MSKQTAYNTLTKRIATLTALKAQATVPSKKAYYTKRIKRLNYLISTLVNTGV